MINTKKAAMFGLDARIALAIFGALSVISGAALYSAIQQSKVVSLVTNLQEASKAFEAFYLDTGTIMDTIQGVDYVSAELVSSSKTGWQGPYLPYSIDTVQTGSFLNKFLVFPMGNNTIIYYTKMRSSDFPSASGASSDPNKCPDEINCAFYTTIQASSTNSAFSSYFAKLDEIIDGSDGYTKGKFKVFHHTANFDFIYLKITASKPLI